MLKRLIFSVVVLQLLLACSDKPVESPLYYPLADGSEWVYREYQVDAERLAQAVRRVRAEQAGPVTTSSGQEFPVSWELTVTSDEIPVSRQLMVVDGDTVKMLSMVALATERLISFDPWFPEFLPLQSGAAPFEHTYVTRVVDAEGVSLASPYLTELQISPALSDPDSLPHPLYGDRMAMVYNYRATGNRTWFYFAPESGKVREATPQLRLQAKQFRSSYVLENYSP